MPRFQEAQACELGGEANTIVAVATPARDRPSLLAIGRHYAQRYPSADGVEVTFYSDSAVATCDFPMNDEAFAASVAGYNLNRRNGNESLNYAPGKKP